MCPDGRVGQGEHPAGQVPGDRGEAHVRYLNYRVFIIININFTPYKNHYNQRNVKTSFAKISS